MNSGKIEKRKPLNPNIKISAGGRPYLDQKEAVRRVSQRNEPDDVSLTAYVHELARLERAVVEAAKAWHEMRLMQAGTSLSLKALMEAVNKLLEFEAKQDQK